MTIGHPEVSTRLLPGSAVPEIEVRAEFDAPIGSVWAVIDDVGAYARVFPAVRKVEAVERAGTQVRCRMHIAMPFPLPAVVESCTAVHEALDGGFQRSWTTESRLYRTNRGSWTLRPVGTKRCEAIYRLHLVFAVPLPRGVVARIAGQAAKSLMDAVRRAV